MKKYIYTILLSISFTLASCVDLLDRSSESQVDSDTMWSTENLASQGMNGIYQALRTPVWSGDLVGTSTNLGHYAWEIFGMTGQTNKGAYGLFSNYNAGNAQIEASWKWCFTGINRANDAINGLPKTAMGADKKAQWIAEAKTMRAYFYIRLVELFGRGMGVPIYDQVVTVSTATKGQSPEAEVWDFIIQSLTEAINTSEFANNTIGKSGRASKGLAYALRGKAYLMRSMSLDENHYQLAVDDFNKVGQAGYGLFDDYAGMFKEANKGNKEMLLAVQNLAIPVWAPNSQNAEPLYGSSVQKYCAPFQAGAKDSKGCWNDIQISPAAVDYFEVLVDNNTVKPFDWDDFIPGYSQTNYNDRMVYFMRNTHNGAAPIHTNITREVNLKLNAISSAKQGEYLPAGNEARIRAAYTNRDPRLEASILTPYSTFKGVNSTSSATDDYIYRWPSLGSIYYDNGNSESTLVPGMKSTLTSNTTAVFIYLFRKFTSEGLELAYRNHSPVDEPLLRYADVLLMCAEALVELNQLPEAQRLVQDVRDRVGMPTMSKYFIDQTTARNYVRDERRREFVGEGVNFFDEMRWRTLKETKFEYASGSAMQVTGATSPGPSYRWKEAWYTWPVPKKEAEMNPNLKRTPGWTY